MAIPANPEAALDALLASRSAPTSAVTDRALIWSAQGQVDAVAAALPNAERFEMFAALSDGTVVSAGFGFRFGGAALAKRVAA